MECDELRRLAAVKRAKLQSLETEFVLACENAASRKCRKRQLPSDRSKWSRSTWNSYLAETIQCNFRLGHKLFTMLEEADKLERSLNSSPRGMKQTMHGLPPEPPAYSIHYGTLKSLPIAS